MSQGRDPWSSLREGELGVGYAARDAERWVDEAAKDPRRGPFARDRARVMHSAALRRLATKTQVVDPATDDFVRNRLTHSLEVAQVGRELGAALGCDADVVETACLAHDIGHPPFGHNGEAVLNELAAPIGGFEGNAQTLRVLTRLEPKVFDPVTAHPAGLNLSRASLDACTKYPWPRGGGPDGAAGGKFGVYAEDLEVFTWLRAGVPEQPSGSMPAPSSTPPPRRCIEAQVMDLADDIAYSVHDVEDAVVGGHLDPRALSDRVEIERISDQVRAWYLPDADPGEVAEALRELRSLPQWVSRFDGSRRALASWKDLSSQLIGRFAREVENATRQRHGDAPLTRYHADLMIPRRTWVEITALKGVAAVYVMTSSVRRPAYERQHEVLRELHALIAAGAPATLEPAFADDFSRAPDDAARARVVIDQIASLTDQSAMVHHARLSARFSSPGR